MNADGYVLFIVGCVDAIAKDDLFSKKARLSDEVDMAQLPVTATDDSVSVASNSRLKS